MTNHFSLEPLSDQELLFIRTKYERESKSYMRVMNFLLIICGITSIAISIILSIIAGRISVLYRVFGISIVALLIFFIVIASFYYFIQIYNLYRDTKQKHKTIESCHIIEKKKVAINNSYHFYLNSKIKYSIEITEDEYDQYALGDEINIEYSQYSNEYFGYY